MRKILKNIPIFPAKDQIISKLYDYSNDFFRCGDGLIKCEDKYNF